jgi:hypothetical protein
MVKLNWAEEVFYRRLHSIVDDFGRYYADHGLLRAACYPRQLGKVSDSDIGKWMRATAEAGLDMTLPEIKDPSDADIGGWILHAKTLGSSYSTGLAP